MVVEAAWLVVVMVVWLVVVVMVEWLAVVVMVAWLALWLRWLLCG